MVVLVSRPCRSSLRLNLNYQEKWQQQFDECNDSCDDLSIYGANMENFI